MAETQRRILVLTLSFGAGHVRAAAAIASKIRLLQPQHDVRVCDAVENSHLLFRAAYVAPYWLMLRHSPSMWSRLFKSRISRHSQQTAPRWTFRLGCRRVFRLIEEFAPDTIVATEVAACEIAVIARRAAMTHARIVNIITDHEAEPVWVKSEVDRYAVADQAVRDELCAWGADADCVEVTGIPVDAGFEARHDPRATRERFSVLNEAPVVLLMGGGMGPTRMDEVAACLGASKMPMHIIAVTGHDTRVKRRLEQMRSSEALGGSGRLSLSVHGWVDDIPALMQAASVLVTKPGGLTTAEAALCRVPMVLFDSIPGPEERNAARFATAGAGIVTRGSDETASAVVSLLRDELRRRTMSANAASLAQPDATEVIARLVLDESAAAKTERSLRTA